MAWNACYNDAGKTKSEERACYVYSSGFYPFPDEESRWGYWCRMALLAGADLDVTPLHKTLLNALADKRVFILSANADGRFEKAGFPLGN